MGELGWFGLKAGIDQPQDAQRQADSPATQ